MTRGRLDDASEGFAIFMIASHTTEIVRHGAAAVLMFAAWLVKDNNGHAALEPIELEVMEENSAYDRWMEYWRANIKFPDDPERDAEYDVLLDNDWPDNKPKTRPSSAGD